MAMHDTMPHSEIERINAKNIWIAAFTAGRMTATDLANAVTGPNTKTGVAGALLALEIASWLPDEAELEFRTELARRLDSNPKG